MMEHFDFMTVKLEEATVGDVVKMQLFTMGVTAVVLGAWFGVTELMERRRFRQIRKNRDNPFNK